MLSIPQLLAFLPLLGVFASPADSTPNTHRPKSPEFLQWLEQAANSTDGNHLAKREDQFSDSQDGVNSAGFYYSLYNDNGAGAKYTEYDGSGQFQVTWDVSSEFLGGKGYRGGDPRSLTWDGSFSAEGDYTLAVYGWTTDPVTEWYVVESHGTGTPGNGNILGQVNSDGGVYDVYMIPYRDVPEIYGVTDFNQLWSVRREDRSTGTVDVSAHFDGWKQLNLEPGNPVFQMVTAEGFSGTGTLDFTVQ
ncbi:glycoside hydrolase family 11 protein [Aspergillus affinis]|uniref:glycoside hydrolase family 11 protein n=1 Tax=Aspergillus affinis TaxID=1070780 RepID=UPI0022FE38BB|nr:putative endo-1 [Aspergillus affinis]KAI9034752.1 putative endo-1 [Aspergillus affinis]